MILVSVNNFCFLLFRGHENDGTLDLTYSNYANSLHYGVDIGRIKADASDWDSEFRDGSKINQTETSYKSLEFMRHIKHF